jgi:hypothetical protein
MTRIHDSRYPNGLAAIASMAPGPVRLMAGDAEGHHDRYRSDGDVGDPATDETRAGEHVEGAGCSADLLQEPPPLRPAVTAPTALSLTRVSAPSSSQANSDRHRFASALGYPGRRKQARCRHSIPVARQRR